MNLFSSLKQDSHHHQQQHTRPSSAKIRRNDHPRTSSTSTGPVPSKSSSTATSINLPQAPTTSTTITTASTVPTAVGLSMPSISSSASTSSVGSNSKAGFSDYTSDTQASSEFPIASDFENYPLDSPATFGSNAMSPPCEANLLRDGLADYDNYTARHGTEDLFELCFPGLGKSTAGVSGVAVGAGMAVPASSCYVTPSYKLRCCPLPKLSWTDTQELWRLMCRKDDLAWLAREPNMFDDHPGLQPRMRAILLDWLNEVCEVYKLHRETYYLAVDYIDRYLSLKKELKKNHLQLLGITALFIAAKVEEIYPPKIGEFAYVTDGACTEEDILREELLLLSALDWKINPVTVIGWLGLYMQINVTSREADAPVRNLKRSSNSAPNHSPSPKKRKITDENSDVNNIQQAAAVSGQQQKVSTNASSTATSKTDDAFVYPQFSGMEFAHTAQLIDLCSLDVGLANFKYSVIAAAALSYTFDRKMATFVSGLPWEEIAPCAKWMEPYFQVICDENASCPLTFLESSDPIKYSHGLKHICPNLVSDSSHIIQTHTTSLDMLDLVSIKIEQMESTVRMGQLEASPAAPIGIESEDGILTPPASNRKSLEAIGGVITAVSVAAP
uniref:Uncharacterized protein n=1 Tax=Anopheles epiroticus TaxID=199890 RepID=A0A182PPQ0_9DIPT